MTYVHVHAPRSTAKRAVACVCPDCKKRTRMLEFFTPWYGWASTCIRCGREWQDGEWMRFESYRYARRDSIKSAKEVWRRMPPASQNHFGVDQ